MLKKKKNCNTILAIETSCDDTSIAIMRNHKVIANQVFTCNQDHQNFGGIIPELASRNHAYYLRLVLQKALDEAKISIHDLNYIAYTFAPGLPGCLHTGKVFAKTLSYVLDKPLIKIDHMIAHAYSFSINDNQHIDYPFLALDASGGHTIIYLFYGLNKYLILNESKDDAIGECLDKIGRILDLPYPGGISLDKQYDETKTNLKLIKHYLPLQQFSFSGIKTHITNLVHHHKQKEEEIDTINIGSSSLKWCIDELLIKINHYIKCYDVKFVAIGGGVAANRLLRKEINNLPIKTILVNHKYSGDNAAMIANLADLLITK